MNEPHVLAGKTVKLKLKGNGPGISTGDLFIIEDWWMNVSGKSWITCQGNPTCLKYGIRSGLADLPADDQVVYGKVGAFGHLIHVSELGDVVENPKPNAYTEGHS